MQQLNQLPIVGLLIVVEENVLQEETTTATIVTGTTIDNKVTMVNIIMNMSKVNVIQIQKSRTDQVKKLQTNKHCTHFITAYIQSLPNSFFQFFLPFFLSFFLYRFFFTPFFFLPFFERTRKNVENPSLSILDHFSRKKDIDLKRR